MVNKIRKTKHRETQTIQNGIQSTSIKFIITKSSSSYIIPPSLESLARHQSSQIHNQIQNKHQTHVQAPIQRVNTSSRATKREEGRRKKN